MKLRSSKTYMEQLKKGEEKVEIYKFGTYV